MRRNDTLEHVPLTAKARSLQSKDHDTGTQKITSMKNGATPVTLKHSRKKKHPTSKKPGWVLRVVGGWVWVRKVCTEIRRARSVRWLL